MSEFTYYVVCKDGCEALGFATHDNAVEYRKQHEWVNPHEAVVKPGNVVENE